MADRRRILLSTFHGFTSLLKRVSAALPAVALACLLAGPAALAGGSLENAGEEAGSALRIWNRHEEGLQNRDWRRAAEELENLLQWKLDQAIPNHFPFSAALIREIENPFIREDADRGSILLDYAEKMAPDFSAVKFARADFLWSRHSPEYILRAFWEYGRGVYLGGTNPGEAVAVWANIVFWSLLAFLLTFFCFSLSLLLRFFPYFLHHLGHILHCDEDRRVLYPLSVLLLFFPLWAGLPWMWLPGLWLVVFWIYAGRKDRTVMIALVVALFLLPTGLRIHSALTASLMKNGVPEIAAAQYGTWSPRLHETLLALSRKNPGDPDILASAAIIAKRMGKYREAEENFREAIRLNPGDAALLNNLGNVYLATNRIPEAMDAYRRAAQLKPRAAVPLYNLGQTHLMNLRLKEAETEFRRAREMQPDLVSYYTGIASRKPNRQSADQPMEMSRFWQRVLCGGGEGEMGQVFWEQLWAGTPLLFGEWTVAGIAVLLFLMFNIGRRGRPIAACERCGRLICARCAGSRLLGRHCSPCVHAFNPDAGDVDPDAVKAKRTEVMRFREKRRNLLARLSLLLPGSGHLLGGREGEGIVYLFLFFCFAVKAAFWRGLIASPVGLDIPGDLPGKVAAVLFFMLFYLGVQYRLQRRLRGGESDFRAA